MLAYILALVIGFGSIAFYMAAFFFPEVHRKSDFIWSGIGFFYALVLWVCAGRMTGGVLLGQVAGVSLIGWLGWQTLTLRRSLTSPQEQTEISPEVEKASPVGLVQKLLQPIGSLFRRKRKETPMIEINRDKAPASETEETAPSSQATEATETQAETLPSETEETAPSPQATEATEIQAETPPSETEAAAPSPQPASETQAPAPTPPEPPEPELVEAAKSDTESKEPLPDTPVEEVAPEAEISPDAEPRGPGDTNMRQSLPEPPTAMEAVPVEPESEKTEESSE
jgi:hypothetical protein